MVERSKTQILAVLKQFENGDLSWRMACKALDLWDYDALLALMREYGLAHMLPVQENSAARTDALADRLMQAAGNKAAE
jgi:hypothetical protein